MLKRQDHLFNTYDPWSDSTYEPDPKKGGYWVEHNSVMKWIDTSDDELIMPLYVNILVDETDRGENYTILVGFHPKPDTVDVTQCTNKRQIEIFIDFHLELFQFQGEEVTVIKQYSV